MALHFIKINSLRFKLIASLIAVSLIIGLISLMVGVNLLYRSVLAEANNRISQDLNVARVIYDERIGTVRLALEISASTPELVKALSSDDRLAVSEVLKGLSGRLKPDFMGVTDSQGHVTLRHGVPDSGKAPFLSINPLVLRVLEQHKTNAGTLVLDHKKLLSENPALAAQAHITVLSQLKNPGRSIAQDTNALVVGAAVPVFSDHRLAGVIYGGFLLNKDTAIVDKIGETVFKNEIYKNRNIGTATIFYNNLRIATSVKNPMGNRALGTVASQEVTRRVLDRGEIWTDRAKVLDDWYITAYEPITDILGQRVGMLYVGVLEAKYSDIRGNAMTVFIAITLVGVIIAIALGWLFTGRIMRPVSYLIRASAEISAGNLSPDIGPISKDDIGQLQRKFLIMIDALKERDKSQKAESEFRLIQSEKQASIGKLAAGVAHEINNPLTAVLTFTHMILRRKDLPDEVRSDLNTVASQTERVRRIVKSLLDFSRQSALAPEPLDVNRLIMDCVHLMENQALIKGVTLSFTGDDDLPSFTLDHNQCQSVLVNMIINALDATSMGGTIDIQTRKAFVDAESGVEISISDTGSGIAPEHMNKLFDPFFTTKEIGKGTGLGLAVSAGIIQRHGGTIKVQSKPKEGTTFTIWLPHKPVNPVPEARVSRKDRP
ncbi:MAG: cache domain-containing protein [Desulfobacteraceae bacterium]|jgi:two-component system NtrC family sensor kinase